MTRRSSFRAVAVAFALLLLAGCRGGDAAPPPAPTSSAASPAPPPSTGSASTDTSADDGPASVAIGGARHVFAQCRGHGSPTVMFESGDESDQFQWSQVLPAVARHTRVCAYDRLGNGHSDPATGCRRTPQLLEVFDAMRKAVGARPPYVLVGTSGGGFLVTSWAYAHPAQTAGIVLAETPHAIIPAREPKELIKDLDCHAPDNVEHRDYVAVEQFAWQHRRTLGPIPMTVITNDYGNTYANEEQQHNVAEQRGWLVLSPKARQVVVTSGHDVPEVEPALTIRQVLRVVTQARKS